MRDLGCFPCRHTQNRITRLKTEQERARERIKETQRRAKEITDLKQRNMQHAAARADAGEWLATEHEAQKELLNQNRNARKQAIDDSRKTMFSLKKQEVKVLKLMRHENESAVQSMRDLEHQRAVERKNVVRMSHQEAKERKKVEEVAALEKLRYSRESKRQELDEDAMVHYKAYNSLAEEEQKLIDSLRKWNTVQDKAFEQLDSVLATGGGAGSRPSSRPSSRATFTTMGNAMPLDSSMTPREPDAEA